MLKWFKMHHVYELIVENINYLWLLSIYDISVQKQNKIMWKITSISASSFCVVMKKQKVSPTVLSLTLIFLFLASFFFYFTDKNGVGRIYYKTTFTQKLLVNIYKETSSNFKNLSS